MKLIIEFCCCEQVLLAVHATIRLAHKGGHTNVSIADFLKEPLLKEGAP